MVPYGYRIRNGEIEIDREKAENLKKLYRLYLDGWAIRICAEETGIPESIASRALSNKVYLGTDVYWPIIDTATFERVQKERQSRDHSTGDQKLRREARPVFDSFNLNPVIFNGKPKRGSAVQWLYDCIEPATASLAVDNQKSETGGEHRKNNILDAATRTAVLNLLK